jgi:ssRNA-specific RNase YbeY (16S rRNA maturation enzyme)
MINDYFNNFVDVGEVITKNRLIKDLNINYYQCDKILDCISMDSKNKYVMSKIRLIKKRTKNGSLKILLKRVY